MKTYDPKQVQVIVGGIPLRGYADGSFIRVAPRNAAWVLDVGADGEAARAKSNDYSGSIEVELMQSSESNIHLSNVLLVDKTNNAGVVPITIRDTSGRSLHFSEQCFLEQAPESAYSKSNETRVWRFLCADMDINFVGGN